MQRALFTRPRSSSRNWEKRYQLTLKASIDPKLQALKDKVGEAEPDTDLLKTMTKDLQEELMKVGQAAYANTGSTPPPGDAGEAGAPPPGDAKAEAKAKDDVIDVDGQ